MTCPPRSRRPLRGVYIQRRAAAIGFEYLDVAGALAELDALARAELGDGLDEFRRAEPEQEPHVRLVEELGDVLFAAVNVSRRLNVDPSWRSAG